ncbi:TlyA family RNA methyltransferase [uncultured Serinicoccus sp.]|uniref:TlyA family RNA methyltransferase n=1 Tax=uncultured Serinicoccus sp. TaxID=735514 RepID=UPI00261D3044|nr:TlyA family RNA methyltransferase [uncultured Serinicoccus sp.]
MSVRLDRALVARGLASSRTQAQLLIRDGLVQVGGQTVRRAAHPVAADEDVRVEGSGAGTESAWVRRGWVGRGAVKLAHALEAWPEVGERIPGREALDVGASTGGFTQVLLERGAARVVALDVGHGQLSPVLHEDPRVEDRPGLSVRDATPASLGGPFEVVVADLSFISLSVVLGHLAELAAPGADLVLLVKPQFEVGAGALGRGGVVRSPAHRERVLQELDAQAREHGLSPQDLLLSPLRGASGNVEYLWWLRRCAHPGPCRDGEGMMGCAPGRTGMAALIRARAQEDG